MARGAEELSGSRGTTGVRQDVCDTEQVEGYPLGFPTTNLPGPYMEDEDRDVCRLGWTLVPFFNVLTILGTGHVGGRTRACRPHSTYLSVTTVGIDSFIFFDPQGY